MTSYESRGQAQRSTTFSPPCTRTRNARGTRIPRGYGGTGRTGEHHASRGRDPIGVELLVAGTVVSRRPIRAPVDAPQSRIHGNSTAIARFGHRSDYRDFQSDRRAHDAVAAGTQPAGTSSGADALAARG